VRHLTHSRAPCALQRAYRRVFNYTSYLFTLHTSIATRILTFLHDGTGGHKEKGNDAGSKRVRKGEREREREGGGGEMEREDATGEGDTGHCMFVTSKFRPRTTFPKSATEKRENGREERNCRSSVL